MKRAFGIAMMIAAMAGQASALSCMAPDPVTTFQDSAAAAETYVVVHGRFSFDPDAMPRFKDGEDPVDAKVPAIFIGQSLTESGFNNGLVTSVTLDVECAVIWCGGLAADTPYLAFLEKHDDGFKLNLGPCPFRAFDQPSPQTLRKMTACLNGVC